MADFIKGLEKFAFGGSDKIKKASLLTPDQEQLMKLITEGLSSGEGPLKDLFGQFNEEDFKKGITDPNIKHFKENILPLLTEKFISGNQAGGSSQRRAQLRAGTDLQSKLAELMYGAQQGQKQNQISGLQTALGKQTKENFYKQGQGGAVQGFIQGAGQGVGQAAGAAIAG